MPVKPGRLRVEKDAFEFCGHPQGLENSTGVQIRSNVPGESFAVHYLGFAPHINSSSYLFAGAAVFGNRGVWIAVSKAAVNGCDQER